ncbi:MAG TPA: c-type cytochrome [Gemmatimonadaceae bacterium]|nr:c-type cytochrome [Gemmatimonadaceae bacterium]
MDELGRNALRVFYMMKGLAAAISIIALATINGCGGESDAAQVPAGKKNAPPTSYVDGGDSMRFVNHPENLPVGINGTPKFLSLTNPLEGNASAIEMGSKLYISYNCIDCHGADGSGAMAPGFSDGRWHFGGTPGAIFESIYEGRPDGMPSWGGRIDNNEIWMLAAYVRSLAKKDLSTENFSGKTIERTGH